VNHDLRLDLGNRVSDRFDVRDVQRHYLTAREIPGHHVLFVVACSEYDFVTSLQSLAQTLAEEPCAARDKNS